MRNKNIVISIVLTALLFYNFLPAQQNEQVTVDNILSLSLEDMLKIKVVTASDRPEEVLNAPANIIVISGDELKNRGYTTLMDLMADLPGVSWTSRYNSFSSQVIRGNSNTKRLILLFDGVVFNPRNGFGVAWADRFPIEGIEKVEFIIGPYASLYGRNTYSGVLNVITKKGEMINGVEVTGLYGKDNQFQGTAIFGKKIGEFDIYCSLYKSYSDRGVDLVKEYPEYYSKENREKETIFGDPVIIPDSVSSDVILPWDNREIYLKIAHSIGLELQLQYNYSDMPKVGTTFTSLYYAPAKECMLTDKTFNASLRFHYNLSNKMSASSHLIYQNFDWIAQNLYLSGGNRWYAQQSVSYLFTQKIHWQIADRNALFGSVSLEKVDESNLIASNPQKPVWSKDDKSEVHYLNISLQDEVILTEKFKAVFGLMYEKSTIYKDVYIPRFSGVYSFDSRNILKAIYAAGYLTPDPEVRVMQDDILGRTDISPEYINSIDLNYTRLWNKNTSTLISVFYNTTNNVIQQVVDSTLPPPYTNTWENGGNSYAYGFDFTLNTRITRQIKSFFSYSFVEGSIEESGIKINRLPTQAGHHFKFGLNYLLWKDKLNFYFHDLFIGDRHTWQDKKINGLQFATPGYILKGYNIIDLNLRTTEQFSDKWHVSIGVRNLLDKKGFDVSYSNYDVSSYTPVRRRWWTVQAGYKF